MKPDTLSWHHKDMTQPISLHTLQENLPSPGPAMVATYTRLEAPYSGMSMNPARTFASALPVNVWTAWWVYFTAPSLGMLLAAELYVRQYLLHQVFCAKVYHHNNKRRIFRCNYDILVFNYRG